jgi:type IV pilus assembly protein PilV
MEVNMLMRQRGSSMIEVLVTMVIVAFGLLGMAGLQSRMQMAEVEAFQRAQALVLLNDMANRIATNRAAAISASSTTDYETASAIGADNVDGGGSSTCAADFSGSSQMTADKRDWCNALQGAAESTGSTKQGAMIGARGCVSSLGNNEFMVTVAWQGLVPLVSPPSSVTCGSGSYNGTASTGCLNDLCRRVVTTVVRIAKLN